VRIVVGKCRGMDERKGYTIQREWNRNLQQTNARTAISCIKGHGYEDKVVYCTNNIYEIRSRSGSRR